MNGPRILAILAAAGLLAATLAAQGRDRGGTQTERTGSTGFTPMPDSSGFSSRGGIEMGPRSTPLGTSGTRGRSAVSSRTTAAVPHGVAVVGPRPSAVFGLNPVYHWHPCSFLPDPAFWGHRDLMAEIQFMARDGFVPCTRVADDTLEVSDYAYFPSGWKGYAFVVAPKGTLHVSLNHLNRGWFRLVMVNKWGELSAGMLQNLIPTGNPEVTFKNPKDEAQAVYVIADDPGWMSSKAYPYQLTIDRSWDPASVDLKNVQVAVGVWGNHRDMSAEFRHPTWVGFGSWNPYDPWW